MVCFIHCERPKYLSILLQVGAGEKPAHRRRPRRCSFTNSRKTYRAANSSTCLIVQPAKTALKACKTELEASEIVQLRSTEACLGERVSV
jgi:hypothetical protein